MPHSYTNSETFRLETFISFGWLVDARRRRCWFICFFLAFVRCVCVCASERLAEKGRKARNERRKKTERKESKRGGRECYAHSVADVADAAAGAVRISQALAHTLLNK